MNPITMSKNCTAAHNIGALTEAYKLLTNEIVGAGKDEKIKKAYDNLTEAFYAAIRAESERIVLSGEVSREPSRESSRNTVTPESRVTERVDRNTVTQ